MYNNYLSNFGRPLVPDDLGKDSAQRHPRFWRRRFLKVFTIYEHGGHLGQWAVTILAIFRSPKLRRLHIKFEQHWPRGFRGEVVWNSKHFSHTNVWCPYKCIGKQTWSHPKKSNVNVQQLFRNFGSPLVPDDLCQDSAPRHPRFWRRRFLKVFTIYEHGRHLGQWAATILAIFHSPNLRRLHMKFEQNWLSSFRGEVVGKCKWTDGRKVITTAHPEHSLGELKKQWRTYLMILMQCFCVCFF